MNEVIECCRQCLVGTVQNYVKSMNWGYRVQLKSKNVSYINAFGSFADAHTIRAVEKTGKEVSVQETIRNMQKRRWTF